MQGNTRLVSDDKVQNNLIKVGAMIPTVTIGQKNDMLTIDIGTGLLWLL